MEPIILHLQSPLRDNDIERVLCLRGIEELFSDFELRRVEPGQKVPANGILVNYSTNDQVLQNETKLRGTLASYRGNAVFLNTSFEAIKFWYGEQNVEDILAKKEIFGSFSSREEANAALAKFGPTHFFLGVTTAAFLTGKKFAFSNPRALFVPPVRRSDLSPEKLRFLHETVRQNWRDFAIDRVPSLWMAMSKNDLIWGEAFGVNAFYAPLAPDLHASALASAQSVVSFQIGAAAVSAVHGIPTVFVGLDANELEHAERLAIPYVDYWGCGSADELRAQVQKGLSSFSAERTKGRLQGFRSSVVNVIRNIGADRNSRLATVVSMAPADSFHVASVCDSNYLPFFLGMAENLQNVAGREVSLHLLALDSDVRLRIANLPHSDNIRVYDLSDLWSREELPTIEQRTVGFRAFSSKARLLSKILNENIGDVLYADCDILFFESPRILSNEFGDQSVLLFPHWNDAYYASRTDGLFNAGMLAVRRGAEPFLRWWSEACFHRCSFEPDIGAVGDQSYLDFCPVLFPEVKIYSKGDQNVARWNLETLGVQWGERRPALCNGSLVKTYHAQSIDSLGLFQMKSSWDQIAAFFSLEPSQWEREPFFFNVIQSQAEYWLTLSRALALKQKLTRFFKSKRLLSPGEVRFWLSDLGVWLLSQIASIRRGTHRRKSEITPDIRARGWEKFWPELQMQMWLRLNRKDNESDQAADRSRSLGSR